MIRAENISFRIGSFQMDRVSLEIAAGEYFVLLGPPGSGKTLFLEALCGLRPIESGRFFLGGRDVTEYEPRKRMLGYVPQDYALFGHRTVEGNIRFGMEAAGVPDADIDRRVGEISEQLGIGYLLHRGIDGLSGGERQQVALARALVIRPRVLLLDEPVSALDESTRESVCRELKRIQRELALTTIHVCHQLQEAFSVADRAGILRNGSFQQIGTMDNLTCAPANEFVANFMRCRNVLTGRVCGGPDRDGRVEVEIGECRFQVNGNFTGTVQMVIRPDRIRLEPDSRLAGGTGMRLPARIRCLSDLGSYVQVELDASFPLMLHTTWGELEGVEHQPGAEVAVRIHPDHIHVLA